MRPARTFRSAAERADHFKRHGQQVKAATEADYEAMANTFMTAARDANTLERTRKSDGALLRYNQNTDHFGVIGADGFIWTYMQLRGTKTENAEYFRTQGGV